MFETSSVSLGVAVRPIWVAALKYSKISRHALSSAALPLWHSSIIIKSYDQKIHISNVTSKTNIKVYGVTGVLVANLNTITDTSFEIANGMYIVKVQANDGVKVVKLISY